jgi:exonuclease SbcD
MLQGTFSHEPPGTLSIFRLLGGHYPVHVADQIGQVALMPNGEWISSQEWCFDDIPDGARALFSCVPTVNKAVVAATVGASDAATAVGEQLGLLLRGFARTNQAASTRGIPTIGVSHGTVQGCITEHDVPMAGFDHEFTTKALFDSEVRAFMLGHIHRHQCWKSEGQLIAYPGSIGCFHYGEHGKKGFLLWQVGAEAVSCELQPTPARRTVDITFSGKPDMEVISSAVASNDLAGASVRVRWNIPEEDRHEVDRDAIERLLAGAAEVKLDGRILPVVRARAAGIARSNSVGDKVRVWARTVEAEAAPLLACLQLLQSQSVEEITERILDRQCLLDTEDTVEAVAVPLSETSPLLAVDP